MNCVTNDGCPCDKCDPRRHVMAEHRSEKLNLHLSQNMVQLNDWWDSIFLSMDATHACSCMVLKGG